MADQTSDLINLVFRISRLMKPQMAVTSGIMHLSIIQTQTLIFLHQSRQATMSDIAAYLRIELPSATSLVNKLAAQKLVTRQADPQDRRLVRISLTKSGEVLLTRAIQDRRQKLARTLSYLTDREKSDLQHILTGLIDRLTAKNDL